MGTIKSNIVKIYCYYFFRSFIFAYVIERLFWASRGMSISDTVYTEFVYAFAMIFLEVPSGLWADRYGRKVVIVMGSLINVVVAFMMLYIYGLWQFSIAILLSAFNGALTSGSVNALLYDSLSPEDAKTDFEKIVARIKVIRYGSHLIAALLGAYFATRFALVFTYQLSLVSTLLALVMVISLKEPKPQQASGPNDEAAPEGSLSIGSLVKMTFDLLRRKTTMRRMMLIAAAIGGVIVYIEEFWQNYFDLIHVNVLYFGIFSGVMSISVIVASHYSPSINAFLRERYANGLRSYHVLLLMMILVHFLIGLLPSIFSILFMGLAAGLAAINETMIFTDLHHRVDSANRATMESVYSMIERVLVVVLGLVFGWVSDLMDVFGGYTALGLVLLVILLVSDLKGRKSLA